ncbi:hypothetical protein FNV43_RR13058 [Rhamnella rubrinervis]|uniref:Uncharacterized protein n=1 Tax=Rhamnella rubrinervis TaxID=2594499 RepID=A0A8K0MEN1_9ROSA|nr:hypothetical protein FNV43_RR13058 [Rhamnella rubrinervis]
MEGFSGLGDRDGSPSTSSRSPDGGSTSSGSSLSNIVLSDSEVEGEEVEVMAGGSAPVGVETGDTVMADTFTPNPSESVNYGLKDLISNISESEVERLRRLCEIPRNIVFRKPEKREGPLKRKNGEIAVHSASLEAGLHFPIPTIIRRFLSFTSLHPLQLTGKGWQSLIGHLVMWFEVYGELPSIDVLKGLFSLRCIGNSGQFYTYMDNLVFCDVPCRSFSRKKAVEPATELAKKARLMNVGLWKLEQVPEGDLPVVARDSSNLAVDPSVVNTIKNILAGKRPTSGLTLGDNAPKTCRMTCSDSRLIVERHQAEKGQASPPCQIPESLGALISAANSALSPQFRSQVDRDTRA